MALQGTLETFSVPEVLRLLSGTRKTGLLALEGDRGAGNVWLAEGQLVGARSDHEADGPIEAVLFDLLRYREGSFVFESEAVYDGPDPAELDVEEALEAAEELLTEWREIESIVPTLDVRVTMTRALAGDEITITATQWQSLTAVGSGTTGRRLGDELGLGELDASRRIRDLVETGLVEVGDPVPVDPIVAVEEPEELQETGSLTAGLAGFVAHSSEEDRQVADRFVDEPMEPVAEEPSFEEPSFEDRYVEPRSPWSASDQDDEIDDLDLVAEADTDPDTDLDTDLDTDPDTDLDRDVEAPAAAPVAPVADDGDPDEFLSQLANLSPRAAAAIEATASTTEAGSAEAELPSGDADEEINRNLLLKFLSSTKN